MKNKIIRCKRQSGVVLIISLIMLLLLSLIGVTGMQVTSFEEKMAGNSRNQNLAFQAAEAGLRGAENYLDSMVLPSGFDGTEIGLLSEVTPDPSYNSLATWSASNSAEYSSGLAIINSEPRYIIKYVRDVITDKNTGLNLGGYGEKLSGSQITVFRVTSRGTGGTDNARVILQSHYGKRF